MNELKWTLAERMAVVFLFLEKIQEDVYRGEYCKVGRPNFTSVQLVMCLSASELNKWEYADLRSLLLEQPKFGELVQVYSALEPSREGDS